MSSFFGMLYMLPQTTLKITSWELMILLVMMFNATCFTSHISQPVSYSVFYVMYV